MNINVQTVVAQGTKYVNRAWEDAVAVPTTVEKAWDLSSKKNQELVKQQQEAALKNLFE